MNRLALEQLRLGPRDTVLEVGFGGGGLLAMILASTSGEVHGVDISEAMVERARRRFRRHDRLRLHLASADALPLPDGSVDKACSVNNIYFWADPAAVMAEFARVIRPGGRLAICFEPADELRKWPGHEYGFRLYEGHEVQRLFADAGFGKVTGRWASGRKPDRFLCLSAGRLGAERDA
jgi:arsenite methyltransferase